MLLVVSVFHENLSSLFLPYLPKFVMKFFGDLMDQFVMNIQLEILADFNGEH